MTCKTIENAKKLAKVDGKTLRMHAWFGQDWEDLKQNVSNHINLKIKKLEGEILSDIIKIEVKKNPHTFVDKEGGNKQLTELEYIMKMTNPILDLKWSETVSKATTSHKIDLRILTGKRQK
ncbi:4497_t:CDS:2 [Entrophospora sp. SA101]|nr:4497_t:CDS:2 [Entrophospora sp. SA101]